MPQNIEISQYFALQKAFLTVFNSLLVSHYFSIGSYSYSPSSYRAAIASGNKTKQKPNQNTTVERKEGKEAAITTVPIPAAPATPLTSNTAAQ